MVRPPFRFFTWFWAHHSDDDLGDVGATWHFFFPKRLVESRIWFETKGACFADMGMGDRVLSRRRGVLFLKPKEQLSHNQNPDR